MEQALVPAATLVISVATLFFSQWRAQKVDDRAAAKDTVQALGLLNEAMGRNIDSLQERILLLESEHKECQTRLSELTARHTALLERVAHKREPRDGS